MTDRETRAETERLVDGPAPRIVDAAIECSKRSPCRSKRGVVIFRERLIIARGFNDKPLSGTCDGSLACKATCRTEAVHAEQSALLRAGLHAQGSDLLHVKTVDGQLVVSGGPSCVQCSKLALAAGIRYVWLYELTGWQRYDAPDFHRRSVRAAASALTAAAEREQALREALTAARENIADRFGGGARNNIDAALIAELDAALRPDAPAPKRSCCKPAPDRSGRSCDKPYGHDGEHWTYGGATLTWADAPAPVTAQCKAEKQHEQFTVYCLGSRGHAGPHVNGDLAWETAPVTAEAPKETPPPTSPDGGEVWKCRHCGYMEHVVGGDWNRSEPRRIAHEAQCPSNPNGPGHPLHGHITPASPEAAPSIQPADPERIRAAIERANSTAGGPEAAPQEQDAICRICQMRLPVRLVAFGVGPRGGTDAVCAACGPRAGYPVDEAKRAEVVALRRART